MQGHNVFIIGKAGLSVVSSLNNLHRIAGGRTFFSGIANGYVENDRYLQIGLMDKLAEEKQRSLL